VPEENFWTLWCKGRLTEAGTPTIRLDATPSGLSGAHLHHPPFFTGRMPFLHPTNSVKALKATSTRIREKMLEFSSTLLPAPSPYHASTSGKKEPLVMFKRKKVWMPINGISALTETQITR